MYLSIYFYGLNQYYPLKNKNRLLPSLAIGALFSCITLSSHLVPVAEMPHSFGTLLCHLRSIRCCSSINSIKVAMLLPSDCYTMQPLSEGMSIRSPLRESLFNISTFSLLSQHHQPVPCHWNPGPELYSTWDKEHAASLPLWAFLHPGSSSLKRFPSSQSGSSHKYPTVQHYTQPVSNAIYESGEQMFCASPLPQSSGRQSPR